MKQNKQGAFSYLAEQFKPLLSGLPGLRSKYITKELDRVSALETQLQNPSDLLKTKGKTVTFYDVMSHDETISGTIDLIKTLVLHVNGCVKAPSDDPAAVERAEWIDRMFKYMMPDIWTSFDAMLDAKVFGYKCAEIIWDVGKQGEFIDKWIVRTLRFKHSVLFDFDYDEWGDLDKLYVGYYYGSPTLIEGKADIDNKFLICVWPYPVDGNYYGKSDLENIYLQYYQKYQVERWRGVYLQGFGMPVIEAKYNHKEMTSSEVTALKAQLDNWQDSMYFLNPAVRNPQTGELNGKLEFKLHEATRTNTTAYQDTIRDLNNSMRRRLLIPDNIGYSTQETGSLAKSRVEFDVMIKVIRDHHGWLENHINPLIRKIEKINFGEQDDYCEWKFDEIDKRLERETLQVLIGSGVIDKRESWIRQYMGVPEITVEEQEEIDDAKNKAREDAILANDPGAMFPGGDGAEGGAATTPANGAAAKKADRGDGRELDREKIKEARAKAKESGRDEGGKEKPDDEEKVAEEYKSSQEPPIPFKQIEKDLDKYEDEFVIAYNELSLTNQKKLIRQVKKNYDLQRKDYKFLDALRIDKGPLNRLISNYYLQLYFLGKGYAVKQITKNVPDLKYKANPVDFTEADEWPERDELERDLVREYGDVGALTREDAKRLRELKQKAFLATGDEEARLVKGIKTIVRGALNSDKPLTEVIASLELTLAEDRKKYATTIARTNAATSYQTAQQNIYQFDDDIRPLIEAYEYSAIIDNGTTEFCEEHNGQVIMKDDPNLASVWPPNHHSCRSTLIPIFVTDVDDPNAHYYDYKDKLKPWSGGTKGIPEGFGGKE